MVHDRIVVSMKNYFIPNKKNNFHPHIFQKRKLATIFVAAFLIVAATSIGNVVLKNTGLLASIQSAFLVDLANEDRVAQRIEALETNPILTEVAQRKANDMAEKGYFAHTSPNGTTPWFWFDQVGYQYLYAGENLAVNFTESVDVHKAWLASPTHRKNIMDGRFSEIGIATAQGFYKGRKATFVVQVFGKPRFTQNTVAAAVNVAVEQTQPIQVSGPDTTREEPTSGVQGVQSENLEVLPFVAQTNAIERALVSPLSVSEWILSFLIGVLLLTLIVRVFVEFRRHHIKHALMLLVLILGLVVLLYTQQEILFGEVILDPQAESISSI